MQRARRRPFLRSPRIAAITFGCDERRRAARPWRFVGVIGVSLGLSMPAPALADHAGPLGAQWHLDEAASIPACPTCDSAFGSTPEGSGHGLTGTTAPTFSDPQTPIDLAEGGRFGRALSAANVRPIFATSALLRPRQVTLLGWVRRSGSPGTLKYIAGQGDDGAACSASSYALYSGVTASDGLVFYIRGAFGQAFSSPSAGNALWDGQWHMVAGVFDGSRVRLYVDGQEVGAGSPAPGVTIDYGIPGNRFYIDGYPEPACGNADFTGAIDEVRVYRRALTAAEIGRLAAATGPTPPALVPDSQGPGSGAPPAPAPGRAPTPPRVTDVRPAAPIRSDGPVVLSAVLDGPFRRLEWDLRGDSRPEIVGRPGQTTVSFRPPPGPASVSVRATGAGGVGRTLTETFTVPRSPRGDPIGRVVAKRLSLLKPVDAIGPPPRNLFDIGTFCVEPGTTVRSAALEISGCMSRIDSVDDIPQAERGILEPIAQALGARRLMRQGSAYKQGATDRVLELTDGWLARGPVTVNGVRLSPRPKAAIALYPQANVIASSNAALTVGDLALDNPNRFVLDTDEVNGRIPVGAFPRAAGTVSKLAGFDIAGLVDVSLLPNAPGEAAQALVEPKLELPSFLKFGEEAIRRAVKVRATARDGLIVDALHIGPLNPDIGALQVEGFEIDYRREPNREWFGKGEACIFRGPCLRMAPPDGHVSIIGGRLNFIGATLRFRPAIPLFTGVDLDHIGFNMGLDPTRLGGRAGVTALGIYDIDGRAQVAFPGPSTPFRLDPQEIGGFPGHFYGAPRHGTTVAISANAALKSLPVVGRVPLGNGYFLYEAPGYVAFGGAVDQSFAGSFSLGGALSGEFNASNGRFNLHGRTHACFTLIDEIFGIGDVCRAALGNISQRGAAGCVEVGISFGVGIDFQTGEVTPYLTGCEWSPYAEFNVRGSGARASAVGLPQVVNVRRGEPSRSIRLDSASGAPRVRITGPGGQVVDSPAGNELVDRGAIRILRSAKIKSTVAAFTRPGTYRIEALPSSPPTTRIRQAIGQPDARVRASVRGRGARRVLSYSVRRRRAQRVTFVEVARDGTARPLRTIVGGGKGRFRFSPAPGAGGRRIEAQFELAGLPAERRTVARFRPPSPTLGRPRGLRVTRRGRSLRASWKPVAGAQRYEVVATSASGVQRVRRARGTRIILKGVPRSSGGRVSVRAVDRLRSGRPARRGFRASARRKTRFEKLPRAPRVRR